jgi:hypothetical protein
MKSKIVSLNAISWKQINSKVLDDVDKITLMKFNQNEKQIVCGSYNGKLVILHAFTFEVLLNAKTLEQNIVSMHFFEREFSIIEGFGEFIRFMTYDTKRHAYECGGAIEFSEPNLLKSFDVAHSMLASGLTSGLVLITKVNPGGFNTYSFKIGNHIFFSQKTKLGDHPIVIIRIIWEDLALFISDSNGTNYYIKLNPKAVDDPNILTLFKFQVFKLQFDNPDPHMKSVTAQYEYVVDEARGLVRNYLVSNKGRVYRFDLAYEKEEKPQWLKFEH